ncbi:MAG: hypothetical protein WBA77_23860 [Microcoleaceae cyanobacterium]
MGILAGRYAYGKRNPQVKQPEQPVVTEIPDTTETPETPETIPTPTPEVTPQPTLPPLPEETPTDNQPDFEFPQNLSHEQINCLKYGGGKSCFAGEYKPNIPEPSPTPQPTHPRQLPPVLPDLPNSQFGNEPDINNIAIAVISGREVKDWTPDYNLAPMSAGVCPPSWVIAYQEQLFCNRRLILPPSQPTRRFRRYPY